MKKIRLKSWDICMQQMKCFVWQNRIYRRIKRLGGKRVEPVFQREVYLQSKICDGILMVAIYLARDLRLGSKNHYMKFSLIRVKENISLGIQ